MKRKLYLFCTKPVMYLTELPMIILLAIAIAFNDTAGGLLKLYPLIITSIGVIVFISKARILSPTSFSLLSSNEEKKSSGAS
jgi:hypothetical protein